MKISRLLSRYIANRQPTLAELFSKRPRPDLDKWEHYIAKYSELFLQLPRTVKLLEIGVYHGGSLRLWSEYFSPDSVIVGVDKNPECKKHEGGNIHVVIGDQGDQAFLSDLSAQFGGFDIVIDDGSHLVSDQIASFESLIRSTRHAYIIEDTHAAYWQPPPSKAALSNFLVDKLDTLHEWFIAAGTSELFDNADWINQNKANVSEMRHRLTSIEVLDSLLIFRLGNNPPPKRLRTKIAGRS
ncbi:23S rRNA U2552 (ribose-2'-O)-methylase RlmE/FtsJ [Bradyrhizobium sp. USDA 4473]